ncbi:MAG: selenocysteine-specific translation elongation factor, partial [Planctomycetes bacterium]|nr:selenocysteine-specific translation elongation factor [Planctomycetota bacterium]
MDEKIYNAVLGTAGHIDHGKSSLVKALTNIDPDRLPEEKEREMTIDIGFANMKLKDGFRIGIIDVPGHEDFIKNMLAGATGVDFVILVVAANEGIMPQTIEHVRIMQLLDIKQGIIALTKSDLADNEMAELVTEEIRSLTKGMFLENAQVIKVSNKTKEGIDQLYEEINKSVSRIPKKSESSVFRMYIQRIFSKKGFGTIVTGVPVSGTLHVNDDVELVQHKTVYKVKKLQAYMADVESVRAGHSSAINLANCDYGKVSRGFVTATPGYYEPVNSFEVEFNYLEDSKKFLPGGMIKLKSGFPIKFYIGTQEADGKILFLNSAFLEPGNKALAKIKLDEPVVIQEGDRYIIRTQTPTYTIGGGIIVNITGQKKRMSKQVFIDYLTAKRSSLENKVSYLDFILKELIGHFATTAKLSRQAHMLEPELTAVLEQLKDRLVYLTKDKFYHKEAKIATNNFTIKSLKEFHSANPIRAGISEPSFKQLLNFDDDYFKTSIQELLAGKSIEFSGDVYKITGFEPNLSKEEKE